MIDTAAALAVSLTVEAVPAEQVIAGRPATGVATLGTFGGSEYGVWEMTPGAMTDVEADELFVVVCGAGTVHFAADDSTVLLSAGVVCRLEAGARTVWTVTETLRKVWVA